MPEGLRTLEPAIVLGYRVLTVELKPTRVIGGVVSVLTGLDLEVECGTGVRRPARRAPQRVHRRPPQ